MKKLSTTVYSAFAVVIAYLVLVAVVEWLRIKAGVASDTCTPVDIIAWLGCMFAASAIAGILACKLLRTSGVISVTGMFVIIGIGLALHLKESSGGSLISDGFSAAFGGLTSLVIAWTTLAGVAAGWALSANRSKDWGLWPAAAVFTGALISLAVVFYSADRYFMGIWGNG